MQYLPHPSLKNHEWHEADWELFEQEPKECAIRRSIRDVLPRAIRDELDQKETDYRMMSPKELYSALDGIEYLGNVRYCVQP